MIPDQLTGFRFTTYPAPDDVNAYRAICTRCGAVIWGLPDTIRARCVYHDARIHA